MRSIITALFVLITFHLGAQNNEIFLFDIVTDSDGISLEQEVNITNNPGYDSQPSFLAKDVLIYAGTRNGQTEILQYTRGAVRQLNYTTEGGEYSPQFIPGQRGISAVRLDPDGLQRLYKYLPRNKKTLTIIEDAVVAYYTWADKNTIVSADIVNDELHLTVHNLKDKISEDLGVIVGRSFHKVPDSKLVSFIDKTSDVWMVKSINPKTGKIKEITSLPQGIQDIAWLKAGHLIGTNANVVYGKQTNGKWKELYTFEKTTVNNLSRIAVSPDGSQLAVVGELVE